MLETILYSLLPISLMFAAGTLLRVTIAAFGAFGYVLRFVCYVGIVRWVISWCAKNTGLTMDDCRIPRLYFSIRGILAAVLLPASIILLEIFGQPGHWEVAGLPQGELVERVLYLLFYSGFCSGITEEMVFRGYVLRLNERQWGKIQGMLIAAILFAMLHFPFGHSLTMNVLRVLLYVSISILLTLLTWSRNSIWDGALVHAFWNMFAVGGNAIAVDSEVDSSALITYVLDGGPSHPLQGLTAEQMLLLAIAIVWIWISITFLIDKVIRRRGV